MPRRGSGQGARRRRAAPPRPTQAERSTAMQARLTRATIESLVEKGYAHSTAVDVCARAGVTRGAFHHHFPSLSALYAAALRALYVELTRDIPEPVAGAGHRAELKRLAQRISSVTARPEFKAVIEIWLAARNDAELRVEVAPAIAQLGRIFSPAGNPRLARRIGSSRRAATFYHLVLEATIGMALGRAIAVDGRPLAHEKAVVDLLAEIADTI